MSFKKHLIGLATLAILSPALANAASSWNGEAELGIVSTTGNTETSTFNLNTKLVNERDQWKHLFLFNTLHSNNKDSSTAERYVLVAKSDYKINDVSYAFGRFSYEDDRFSGFEYQATETLGYGRHIIQKSTLKFDVEGGPGIRQSKPDDGSNDNEGILYLSGNLKWDISQNAVFTEDFFTEIGEDITITKSVTGLKSQINGDLAMKVTFTAKHTSKVPALKKKVDTETAVSLVYSF
ncbi:MAG: DUF481 domain-containing protein [Gammaproteobacteria bacterium]|nr:DUF481 domain-containing protein [Gammaproteobacteria bacterium]